MKTYFQEILQANKINYYIFTSYIKIKMLCTRQIYYVVIYQFNSQNSDGLPYA